MKTCPHCAEQVQDRAQVCRYCGHKFGFRLPKFGCGGIALILAALLYAGYKMAPQEAAPQGAPIVITAADFSAEYRENEAAAKARFDGHRVQITGEVMDVKVNLTGQNVINLLANRGAGVSVHLNDNSQQRAMALRAGDRATVTCNRTAMMLSIPIALDCELA